jgi:cyclic pyranopterin phosphate synthase
VDLFDRRGRGLSDLRISVTDRCNFRCGYCMPREVFGPNYAFFERSELLTFEEISRVVAVFAGLGVNKVRLTGGEPLLRRDLPRLVAMISAIGEIDEIALTTNGALLAGHAATLRDAGLTRVTVSLDALDQPTFEAMTDSRFPVGKVIEGILAARQAGLAPLKVNAVVRRGVNEHAVANLARFGRDHGVTVRYIEYMDVGTTNGWRRDEVVPAEEILRLIETVCPVVPVGDESGVAERYRFLDGVGEIGVIASVTQPFCRTCVRARLSSIGELYTCLFATRGHDVRGLLRGGADDEALAGFIATVWRGRNDRYSELRRDDGAAVAKVEMSTIGG